jgi:multidrug resistance protein
VFSSKIKVLVILMTVFGTIFSPLSSFIYLPAITPIADAYHRSLGEINLTVTVFQVMQAVAPLFFGDLSDQIGRRPAYALTFAIYLGANIGLALQHSYAALMVLRAMQSTGSSATVAIGSAVVADLTTPAERGGYITAVQSSIMFAPALAPVLGGILTQYLGWRSTFWFLTIGAGIFLMVYLPFVPEVSLLFLPLLDGETERGKKYLEPSPELTSCVTDRAQRCREWIDPSAMAQHVHHLAHSVAPQESPCRISPWVNHPRAQETAVEDPHPEHLGGCPHHL